MKTVPFQTAGLPKTSESRWVSMILSQSRAPLARLSATTRGVSTSATGT
jgi:hypothetical protein